MKHLKSYENANELKIGDYVELYMIPFNKAVKIINIRNIKDFSKYEVEFDDGEKCGVNDEDIVKKLTKLEVKMMRNANKYNI
jgi:hypothetical protein